MINATMQEEASTEMGTSSSSYQDSQKILTVQERDWSKSRPAGFVGMVRIIIHQHKKRKKRKKRSWKLLSTP